MPESGKFESLLGLGGIPPPPLSEDIPVDRRKRGGVGAKERRWYNIQTPVNFQASSELPQYLYGSAGCTQSSSAFTGTEFSRLVGIKF